jgi:glutathione peroxidase
MPRVAAARGFVYGLGWAPGGLPEAPKPHERLARSGDGNEHGPLFYRHDTGIAAFRFRGTGPARGIHREQCGFTPQYQGLETLYRKYFAQGFAVLGFPCNQFGAQEPGDAAEIARFCSRTYNVTFPTLGKIDVNGAAAHPLYRFLKGEAKGVMGTEAIKWNFTKFLIDRKSGVAARFAPAAAPERLEKEIEKLL